MQKLLIVEDEKSIFFLINSCILYKELGLELVGYAENGKIAYDMILEKRPDIVITDITMPLIDGLELIEKVQERHMNPKFIIISGYAQFEFAKKAVRLGVKDYLLKPINSKELNQSLVRLTQEISETGSKKIFNVNTDNHKEKIRTSFVMSVLYREFDFGSTSMEQINQDYFCAFKQGYFSAIVVKVDYYSEVVIGIKNHVTENLIDIIQECFENLCCEISLTEHQENIYGILNIEKNLHSSIEAMKAACKRLVISGKKLVEEYTDASITVCFGIVVSDISGLSASFDGALHLLDMRVVYGVDRALYAEKQEHSQNDKEREYVLSTALLNTLIEKVECNELEAVRTEMSIIIQDALEFCRQEDVSVHKTIQGVVLSILSTVKQKGNFPNEFMNIYQEMAMEINKCSRYQDIIDLLPEKMTMEMEKFQTDEQSDASLIVKVVLDYIAENYQKPLKLEEVAEQVYITPAYLGIIFKKETGKNFTTYLTELRMKKAKELLLDPRININEITYKVGYNNVRYFSRTFKENVGITPKEYRKIHAGRR